MGEAAQNIFKGVVALLVEGECETFGEETLSLHDFTGTLCFNVFAFAADVEAWIFLGFWDPKRGGCFTSGDNGLLDLLDAGATGDKGDEGVEFPLRLLETSDTAVDFTQILLFFFLLLFSFLVLIFRSPC